MNAGDAPRAAAPDRLLEALATGACVVTGGQRLARSLRQAYDQRQIERGLGAWPSAEILPWNAWSRAQHRRLSEDRLLRGDAAGPSLLGEAQADALWQGIVENDDRATLLQSRATARRARQAWQLLRDWRIAPAALAAEATAESEVLLDWVRRFQALCADQDWLDPADLSDWLAERARLGEWGSRQPLVLTGFDELSPAQQGLLQALAEAGVDCQWLEAEGADGPSRAVPARVTAADPEQEAELAAS